MTQYLILLPIFPIWVVDHHWWCQVSERLCDVGAALEALVSGRLPAVASPPCFASPALPPPPSLPDVPSCIYEYPRISQNIPGYLRISQNISEYLLLCLSSCFASSSFLPCPASQPAYMNIQPPAAAQHPPACQQDNWDLDYM